ARGPRPPPRPHRLPPPRRSRRLQLALRRRGRRARPPDLGRPARGPARRRLRRRRLDRARGSADGRRRGDRDVAARPAGRPAPDGSAGRVTVTMTDVARRSGVSVGTVSNVLHGTAPVSDATRTRVLAAIEELGYRQNEIARS